MLKENFQIIWLDAFLLALKFEGIVCFALVLILTFTLLLVYTRLTTLTGNLHGHKGIKVINSHFELFLWSWSVNLFFQLCKKRIVIFFQKVPVLFDDLDSLEDKLKNPSVIIFQFPCTLVKHLY